MAEKVLKEAKFKSYEWANSPVILDSLFREYDLRNPIHPLMKGGKQVAAGVNTDGFRILGQAYGTYVRKTLKSKKIVVANDYRYYARGISFAFITGVLSAGVDVIDIGVQLSPVLYFAQYHYKLKGGAMITASHNDNGWTGVKLAKGFSKTFNSDDIEPFKRLVYSGKFIKGKGNYTFVPDFKELYIKDIVKRLKPFVGKKKLKIIVSGSNGLGGVYLAEALQKLGFDIRTFMNDLDWDFPNFNPNPEVVKFLEIMGENIRQHKADLGVSADGDGDRLGIVDENGKAVFADRTGLFLSRYIIENAKKNGAHIIIDVKSTNAYSLDNILNKYKTKVIFCKTGHAYVKAASEKYDALAGFEKSGHFFLRGKYGRGYDDAVLNAAWVAVILSESDKKMSELLAEQPKSFQTPTLEPSVKDDKEKYVIVDKVIKYFQELKKNNGKFAGLAVKELITVNGVRFVLEGGAWGLVRASSNQPVLVLVCESFTSRRQMYDIMEALQAHLKQYDLGEYDQQLPPYKGE